MTARKDGSLHKLTRADISERILSGEWPPGHRVPFEHELMAQYGCSRMTVNKALAPLAEQGMIIRRRKAGTLVARPRIYSVVLDIPDIAAEVTARGEPYSYELLSRRVATATRAPKCTSWDWRRRSGCSLCAVFTAPVVVRSRWRSGSSTSRPRQRPPTSTSPRRRPAAGF